MSPKISVVIPVHNRTQDLAKCLEGLASQVNIADLQILVIDDASTDTGLFELAKKYQVEYFRLGTLQGSAYSKNIGLIKANGEFVLFLDSDIEFISRTTITTMVKIFNTYPKCGQVGGEAILGVRGNAKYIFGRNISLTTGSSRCDYIQIRPDNLDEGKLFPFDYIPTSNCMIRKEIGIKLHGFDDAFLGMGEDKDFGYRLKKLGYVSYVSSNSVVVHKFTLDGRYGSALSKQYRTQIRFLWRHFGYAVAVKIVANQFLKLLRDFFHPSRPACQTTDPLLLEYERHYREDLLGFRNADSKVRRKGILYSAGSLIKSFAWNLVRGKNIKIQGSRRVQELQILRSDHDSF